MLQCLRQLLTNGGLEGTSPWAGAPHRNSGSGWKEVEQAVSSRQAGQKVRKASGPCMVAVPMGKEKFGIFGESSITHLTLSLSHQGRDRHECSDGEGGTSQDHPTNAAKEDPKQQGS